MSDQTPVVGIDLGTTFSVVANVDRDGKPVTIVNEEGSLSTPSVVYFDSDCTVVGEEAVNAAEFLPERASQFAKRDMGNDFIQKSICGKSIPPEVVQALVLQKLKTDAELKIGPVKKAVVTVPAYFNEPRRKATQDAGLMAGLEVLDIINEPTAAAIAYGVNAGFISKDAAATGKENVLVYDLGGGTFDLTIMKIRGKQFNAVATAGDVHLGGMDWDSRVMNFFAEQFMEMVGLDPRTDEAHQAKLLDVARRAKKTLSARDTAQVRFGMDGQNSTLKITRGEFESLTEDLVERTRLSVNRILKDSGMKWSNISRLLLVGGSTRMPMIQAMLEADSGLKCDRSLSPDEAVAHGAAVYAQTLVEGGEQSVTISNVNSHDLGVLGRNPQTKKRMRQLMIPRNTSLPATKRRQFVTSKKGQKEVLVNVVEGGTSTGEGATKIGKCRVSNLPEELEKGTSVFVTFQYNVDGRLSVSAEIPAADANAEIAIQRAAGMSETDLEFWTAKIAEGIKIDADEFPTKMTEDVANPHVFTPAAGAAPAAVDIVLGEANEVPSKPQPIILTEMNEVPVDEVALKSQPVSQANDASVAEAFGIDELMPPTKKPSPKPQPKPSSKKPAPKPRAPKPRAPKPDVPVLQEQASKVSSIELMTDEGDVSVDVTEEISPIGEPDAAKVDESRIIIHNEEAKTSDSVEMDGLDDFFNNLN